MLGSTEHLDVGRERLLEPVLRLEPTELRGRLEGPDQGFELGHEVAEHRGVRAQGVAHRRTARLGSFRGLGEELLSERAQRLAQRKERDVTSELVELAADEGAVSFHDRSTYLVDEAALARARISGHEDQLRAALGGAGERRQQQGDLGLAAVEALWQLEPCGVVSLADLKGEGLARAEATLDLAQVRRDAPRALVAGLGPLLEQAKNQTRDRRGEVCPQ